MATKRKDYSRLVTIDLSPTEAAIIAGCLATFKRRGRVRLGGPVYDLVEGLIDIIQRQLQDLDWPMGHGSAGSEPVARSGDADSTSCDARAGDADGGTEPSQPEALRAQERAR